MWGFDNEIYLNEDLTIKYVVNENEDVVFADAKNEITRGEVMRIAKQIILDNPF